MSAKFCADLKPARVDVGDGDMGAEGARGLRHRLADKSQTGNPNSHGRSHADAPRVSEANACDTEEGAEFMLDFGRQFDAEPLAFVGGGKVNDVPTPMPPVIAEEDGIPDSECADATAHGSDYAHMLIA